MKLTLTLTSHEYEINIDNDRSFVSFIKRPSAASLQTTPVPSSLCLCGSKLGQRHDASPHSQWEAAARVHVLSWNTGTECLRENVPRDGASLRERGQ